MFVSGNVSDVNDTLNDWHYFQDKKRVNNFLFHESPRTVKTYNVKHIKLFPTSIKLLQ